MKATQMTVDCPLCNRELSADESVREHLVAGHTKPELAAYIETELAGLSE